MNNNRTDSLPTMYKNIGAMVMVVFIRAHFIREGVSGVSIVLT